MLWSVTGENQWWLSAGIAIAWLRGPATWPFLQVSLVCQQGAGVPVVQFSSSALCMARPQVPWAIQLTAPCFSFPNTPHGFFTPVQTSSALTGIAVYFSKNIHDIRYFQAPVFLALRLSSLALALGLYLPLHTVLCSLPHWCLSQRSSQNTPCRGGGCKLAANSSFQTSLQETSAPRACSKHSSAFLCVVLAAAHSALIMRTWSLQERWMMGAFCILLFMNHVPVTK